MRKSQYVMVFPVKDKYLFINGLSGAIKLVSRETAQKYFNNEVAPELSPFHTHLTSGEEVKNAQAMCDYLLKNAAQCADGTLALTYDCNLRCPYCYEIWVKKPDIMKAVMDEYVVDKAFEALESLNRECTKKSLTLTGGEPLMEKNEDIVKYILKKGNDLAYSFTIFTNGVELKHFLSYLSFVNVDHLQITLDGPRSLHDRRRIPRKGVSTFDTIVENIEEARAMGLQIKVRSNTDEETLSKIDELAEFFRERGWSTDPHIRFSLAPLFDEKMNPKKFDKQLEIYERIMDLRKKTGLGFFEAASFRKLQSVFDKSPKFWPAFWHCNAVSKRYVFDPLGDVYPCREIMGWKEQAIGVYVPELMFNENYTKWRKRTIFAMEECMKCNLALICGGDCGYASLMNKGDLYGHLCVVGERTISCYLEYLYDQSEWGHENAEKGKDN